MKELNAYCIKCKENKVTNDFAIAITDSGREKAHGVCPNCGTPIMRLLGVMQNRGRA